MSILSEKSFRLLALTYLLMFAAARVFAVQCSDIYSNGIQNNDSGGKIEIEDYISINGGGQDLVTNSLSGGSNGCAGQNCIAAGGPFFSSSPSFQTSTNADGNINVSKNSSLVVGNSGDYRFGEVNVGQGANLTFSASQSVYYFSGGWEIGKNAPLTLAPGDYWINGDVKIEQGVGLNISPAGTVRIFASGDVEIVKNAAINSGGSAGQLLIYSEKSIKIDQGVGLKGYLYSNDEIKIEKNAAITGGISSKGTLGIEKGVSINYVSPTGDFGSFCDAAIADPVLVGVWWLDEINWDGTEGEVIDSSGNGLHGKAVSVSGLPIVSPDNPALSGNPGTCSYGVFNGSNSGYIRINDPGINSPLDIDTALTVTSWVYPRSYPTGEGLRTIVSKDENFQYHLDSRGRVFWWWGGGSNQMRSTTTVPLDTWSHIAIVYKSGSQQIYINGVLAGTHNDTGRLITQNDPVFIGTDLNSNRRSFDGSIDDVQIYNGDMTQSQVQSVYTARHPCIITGPDHYHISHAGTGITCEQSVITITPHDASHAAVSADGTTITLSSTPGNDGWTQITAAGTLTGNQYTFASNTSVQLGLSKLSPASLDIDITDGSATDVDGDTSGEDPPIVFSDVVFKFYSNGTLDNIGTQVSGKDSNVAPGNQTLTLKAIKTNETTGRCDALINGGVVNIGMGYECNNPASCVLGTGLSITGANPAAPVPGVSNGASLSYQSVGLNFNASGEASFVLNYLDAGQITLHASADLPVGNTVKTVTGSSNAFVVKPAGFCLESDAGLGACGATGAACAPFKKAGENFNLVVSAKRWGGASDTNYCDNTTTQNFAGPVTLGSTLDSTLVGSAAGLGVTTAIISAGTSGGRAVVSQTVDNVGNFVFFGSTENYLNTGPIANSSGELIGRFVPYQFEIKDRPIALANFGYAYVGQPFTVKFDIEAQNIDAKVVTNYNGDLADLVSGDLSYGIRNNATSPLSSLNSRVIVIPSTLIWSDGQSSHDQLLTVSRNGLEAPFVDLQVGVVVDAGYNEGGITIGAITLDLDTTLDAADDRVLIAEMSLKVGRLFSQDVWGPENTALDVPLRVEYWDGSQWLAAAGDGTALDRSEIVFTSSGGSASVITSDPITAPIGSNPSVIFAQDPTGASVLTFGDGLSSAATGDSLMQVGAPGSTGFFTMDIDLSNYPWLRFDWNQDGDHDNDTALPTVNIRFETYRGHDRVIYWQEVGL